jgi:hypothetical protein
MTAPKVTAVATPTMGPASQAAAAATNAAWKPAAMKREAGRRRSTLACKELRSRGVVAPAARKMLSPRINPNAATTPTATTGSPVSAANTTIR